MDKTLIDKLTQLEASLNELEQDLSKVDISKDPQGYAEMAKRHLKMAVDWKGEILGVLETRRHYGNYFKGIANFKEIKSRILNEKNPFVIYNELDWIKQNFSEELVSL